MRVFAFAFVFALVVACSDSAPTPEPPPCDQLCIDSTAIRGVRETMKQVFNLTLQGKNVGMHDFMVPCPLGGKAHIFGTATSNAVQGATEVDLTYEISACVLLSRDTDPKSNYNLTITGTIHQRGIIAVQPSATTALGINGDAVTITGTVYDPPLPFDAKACPLVLSQDGNNLSGTICGRGATILL